MKREKKGFSHGKIWMLDSETESPTWDEWNQTNIYDEWDENYNKGKLSTYKKKKIILNERALKAVIFSILESNCRIFLI